MHCNTVKLRMFKFHNFRFTLVIFYYTIIINPLFHIHFMHDVIYIYKKKNRC